MPQSQPIYDILTFGDLCVDLIVTGDDVVPQFGQVEKLVGDYVLEMGGSCSIFACQAARLGLRVGILGRVGEDDFGRLVLSRLKQAGVDTQHVIVDPGLKTGLGIALCRDGDRAILTYPGSLNAVYPEDIKDSLLASTRHLHHGSFFLHSGLREAMPTIFKRALSLGLSTSLDTNWDPDEQWNSGLDLVLPLTHLFFPNEQELLHITRRTSISSGVTALHNQGVSIVAVKMGEKGATLSNGQRTISCSVSPACGGDSVGAGDSFDAGLLVAWLRGLPLEICLKIACACGWSVASQIGGLQGQPDWHSVNQLIVNKEKIWLH